MCSGGDVGGEGGEGISGSGVSNFCIGEVDLQNFLIWYSLYREENIEKSEVIGILTSSIERVGLRVSSV